MRRETGNGGGDQSEDGKADLSVAKMGVACVIGMKAELGPESLALSPTCVSPLHVLPRFVRVNVLVQVVTDRAAADFDVLPAFISGSVPRVFDKVAADPEYDRQETQRNREQRYNISDDAKWRLHSCIEVKIGADKSSVRMFI